MGFSIKISKVTGCGLADGGSVPIVDRDFVIVTVLQMPDVKMERLMFRNAAAER
jgi:hypothetical protein